jgi:hypothetical protein
LAALPAPVTHQEQEYRIRTLQIGPVSPSKYDFGHGMPCPYIGRSNTIRHVVLSSRRRGASCHFLVKPAFLHLQKSTFRYLFFTSWFLSSGPHIEKNSLRTSKKISLHRKAGDNLQGVSGFKLKRRAVKLRKSAPICGPLVLLKFSIAPLYSRLSRAFAVQYLPLRPSRALRFNPFSVVSVCSCGKISL